MAQTKVKLISDGVIVQGNLHASHGITTAHIGEGSNLYYTDARVGSYLSTNSFATESYVGTQIANLVDSSPSALNTLNELAAALGDDANFSTTVTNSIALKAPLASPSFTGNATFGGNVTLSGQAAPQLFLDSNTAGTPNYTLIANASSQFIIGRAGVSNDFILNSGNATFVGNLTLNTNGTNFTHGHSGNGLVLSHHNVGPSNAIVSGDASNPDNLYINNSGAASDWTNVVVGGNLNTNTVQISNGVSYNENIRMFPGSNDYSSIILGAVSGTSGTGVGQWSLVRYPSATHSNKFSIRHNATDAMIITKEGNVMIGKTSQSGNAALTVKSMAGGNTGIILVEGDTTNDGWGVYATTANEYRITRFTNGSYSDKFIITSDGNVGIGASPVGGRKLQVSGRVYIEHQGTDWNETTPGLDIGAIHLDPVGSGANNTGNAITFGASDHANGTVADAGIYTRSDGAFGTKMYFATTDSYAVGSKTRMMINESGQVGIGTASPSAKLEVVTAVGGDAIRLNFGQSADIFLGFNAANPRILLQDNSNVVTHNFQSNGDNYIVGSNVGIGVTNPSAKLHITEQAESNYFLKLTGTLGTGNTYGFKTNGGNSQVLSLYDVTSTNRLAVFGDTEIQLATGGTARLYIGSSGNVGIGETSPASKLTVRKDSAGGRGGEISIVNYASNTIGNEAALNFGLESSTYAGDVGNAQIKATVMAANAASDMVFSTWNGSSFGERMRIKAAGEISFNAKIQQNPHSTVLSNSAYNNAAAVQAYASNTANVYPGYGFHKASVLGSFLYATSRTELRLRGDGGTDKVLLMADSDYEEGTFTPRLQGSGGQVSHTQQNGYYTKVGNIVTVSGTIRWNSNGSNANNTTKIEGLPFVAANVTNGRHVGSLGAMNGMAQGDTLRLVIDPGHAGAYIIQQNSTNYSHHNTISANGDIYGFSITYKTS